MHAVRLENIKERCYCTVAKANILNPFLNFRFCPFQVSSFRLLPFYPNTSSKMIEKHHKHTALTQDTLRWGSHTGPHHNVFCVSVVVVHKKCKYHFSFFFHTSFYKLRAASFFYFFFFFLTAFFFYLNIQATSLLLLLESSRHLPSSSSSSSSSS